MFIYFHELGLEEGFQILDKENKEDRLIRGRRVSACSGWELFKRLRGQPIKCWSCGCVADRWVADQARNNKMGYPVVNLYGIRDGRLVLMNRDHIIPKSLGGLDMVENLRPACAVCNTTRQNVITDEELKFRQDNPHLWSQKRLEEGIKNALKRIASEKRPEVIEEIWKPFVMIGVTL